MKYLGETFDIHTGGIDHIPVHHNNEIAQSECATGKPLAHLWLHHEHLLVEGQKMSKSIGNVFTLNSLRARSIHPLSYRYWVLTGHYRTQMNFTWEAVTGAQEAFKNILYTYIIFPGVAKSSYETVDNIIKKMDMALSDNLDTPKALALLNEQIGIGLSSQEKEKLVAYVDDVLGLNIASLGKKMKDIPQSIKELGRERAELRAKKLFSEADKYREEIEKEGYEIHDLTDESVINRRLEEIAP